MLFFSLSMESTACVVQKPILRYIALSYLPQFDFFTL